jgi:membrane-associated phospholipid phosphatase
MPLAVRRSFLAALSCAAAVVALGIAADDVRPIRRFDLRSVLRFEHRTDKADSIALVIAHLGDPLVFVVLAAALVVSGFYFGRRRQALAAMVILVGANLSTQIAKVVFENPHLLFEPRFELTLTNGFPSRDSYPSGHVTAASSLALAALLLVPARHRASVAAGGVLLVAAVGISVILLAWHFPSDVVGGVLVTAAWGFALRAVLLSRASVASRGAEDSDARQ